MDIQQITKQLSTVKEVLEWASAQIDSAEVYLGHGWDDPWDEALAITLNVLGLNWDVDESALDRVLIDDEKAAIASMVKQRVEGLIPTAYLTNEAWFAGRKFFVDERVLIPRSPFAEIIESQLSMWLDTSKLTNILDLCTGSGCIAITAALAFEHAQVDGADISEDALAVAKINVDNYRLNDRMELIQSDVLDGMPEKKYDLILSNPPYVDAEDMASLPAEYRHEPELGLAAGDDGLDIVTRILKQAHQFLTPEGVLVVEVGNSEAALAEKYPQVPFLWLDFEYGGHGVFMLTAKQLQQYKGDF